MCFYHSCCSHLLSSSSFILSYLLFLTFFTSLQVLYGVLTSIPPKSTPIFRIVRIHHIIILPASPIHSHFSTFSSLLLSFPLPLLLSPQSSPLHSFVGIPAWAEWSGASEKQPRKAIVNLVGTPANKAEPVYVTSLLTLLILPYITHTPDHFYFADIRTRISFMPYLI